MTGKQRIAPGVSGILALALATACGGGGGGEDAVATVGGSPITVDHVVEYMQSTGYGANRDEVERAVDELVAMKLVALRAMDRHRLSAAESLRLQELEEAATWSQYREDVIHKGITVDEERLREWYDENVTEEVHARHVLIPASPTDPDSVRQIARAKADSLLLEAKAGADFAELAREHSSDGSANRGGSLGYFSRGQMVAPFEQAAFGTDVGEIAPEVVETQFGYHLIKVEDRRKQSFEELREEIEEQLSMPERQQAEQAFLTGLMEESQIEFLEANIDRLLEIIRADQASEPVAPTDEERDLELVTFASGSISLGEIWDLFEMLPEANRRSIAGLEQADMVRALSQVVQRRLIMARAAEADLVIDSTRQAELEERQEMLWAQAYLNAIVADQTVVTDEEVREYYDGHTEFYRDQAYEDVREQIRGTLIEQRRDRMSDPVEQRRLVEAVADSQAGGTSVERNEGLYDRVLEALREAIESSGGAATG